MYKPGQSQVSTRRSSRSAARSRNYAALSPNKSDGGLLQLLGSVLSPITSAFSKPAPQPRRTSAIQRDQLLQRMRECTQFDDSDFSPAGDAEDYSDFETYKPVAVKKSVTNTARIQENDAVSQINLKRSAAAVADMETFVASFFGAKSNAVVTPAVPSSNSVHSMNSHRAPGNLEYCESLLDSDADFDDITVGTQVPSAKETKTEGPPPLMTAAQLQTERANMPPVAALSQRRTVRADYGVGLPPGGF